LKTLLIDNHDSFTYNLHQLLAEANGEEPTVVTNDAASWADLTELEFHNIVISPGPGSPEHERDFGVCAEAIRAASVPLLGVCLGHQGICWVHGAAVIGAPEVMHGRISAVLHGGSPLFAGIPRELRAVRYHSLCVGRSLPPELEPIAWTRDGVLMGVAHRTLPQWGVQFHPESICTEHGRRLLANFRDLTRELGGAASDARRRSARGGAARGAARAAAGRAAEADGAPTSDLARDPAASSALSLQVERLDTLCDPEAAFVTLYGESEPAFWLDSSRIDERARFSFMGDASGPLGATITYDVHHRELRIERAGGAEVREESIFDHLSSEMRRMRRLSHELPFDFDCGFVGYFGYELKADCEGSDAHRSSAPDASFLFADRLIAFDHLERRTYLLCLADRDHRGEAERWLAETTVRLTSLRPLMAPTSDGCAPREPTRFHLSRSHGRYLEDIATCKQRLREGETYEVCLTNRITADLATDPLSLYRILRGVNPAPFCAYLRFGESAVLSSSPERFLSVDRERWVEAKPIKGTCARGATPAEDTRLAEELRSSEKNRAENLMIADLLRNDLGRVCEVGSVHVPSLMRVESYETVHQLVSTVRGRLREDLQPPDCIRACFPAGSMTGTPKRRTMEIIDELEEEARGVYSGAIGYLGLNGACDLSVVIRTIVIHRDTATLGVGGAIVMQSDAEDEYQETLLKARAPMAAIDPGADVQRVFEQPAEATAAAPGR
jgi:para-aminobenzoate synthetase